MLHTHYLYFPPLEYKYNDHFQCGHHIQNQQIIQYLSELQKSEKRFNKNKQYFQKFFHGISLPCPTVFYISSR